MNSENPELAAGTRLGPYEVAERLGAGGMGEVYRGIDTRLGRNVAIKILAKRTDASDAERKRFVREARAISALNHPHICSLYDIGTDNGHEFLIMEHLEGETLAARLKGGPLPLDEATRYAIEIASALERAHRQGIIHRDLKPGNIMLTKSGAKLLDFGLARFAESVGSAAPLTADDAMIGTVEYMAPEQLSGGEVDARADIFSFGVLLYEMLTGTRPFTGHNRASVIGAILFAPPPPALDGDAQIPPELDRIVRTCLEKDRENRIQSAHDLRLQLQWIAEGAPEDRAPRLRRRIRGNRLAAMWAAAAFIAGGVAASILEWQRTRPQEHQVRFTIDSPAAGQQVDWPVLSPDGTKLAFITETTSGERTLWIRDLASTAARPLPATQGATQPFWSPDSDALAFFLADKLEVMRLSDDKPHAIATAQASRGGSWSSDGTIIFAPHVNTSLWMTDATGSSVRALTRLADRDVTHRWPEFLPDGDHFLFVIRSRNLQRTGLYVGSVHGGEPKKIATIQSRAVASNGWLLFITDRKLWRQRFDAKKVEVSGEPVQIASGIAPDIKVTGANRISVSRDGSLAFASADEGRSTIQLRSRTGTVQRTVAPAGYYVNPDLAPDEKTLALSRIDEESGRNSIWLLDLATNAMTPFVDDDANADSPVWSADGRSIYYTSDRRGPYEIYVRAVGAASADHLVLASKTYAQPVADSAAGLLCHVARPSGGGDYMLWRHGSPAPQAFFTDAGGGAGDGTRDGKWFAAMGIRSENTRSGLEVRSLDDPQVRIRVGADGTSQPTWRSDGRELYFVDADGHLIAADFHNGTVGRPAPLFPVDLKQAFYSNRCYVPNHDGTEFLVLAPVANATRPSATVVLHWDAR